MTAKDKITAKILADSISPHGVRMTTMEIEYPRFILAELNTHRMLSKNSASSRAIPVKAMHEQINQSPAEPVFWGKNQAGMQAKAEISGPDLSEAKYIWGKAKEDALHWARALAGRLEVHKQVANRITEPWMTMKTVISGTEWRNFWWLRCHADAQPEINELAIKMRDVYVKSIPQPLKPGEWHVPYVSTYRDSNNSLCYTDGEGNYITAEQAKIISASCCAQVSYRKNDDSFEKAEKIYRQLIESQPCHASPVEHQATPMQRPDCFADFGTTHLDRADQAWSGNLRGWIQHRKLIAGEAQW
jgi:thymidylate synthase ThyX